MKKIAMSLVLAAAAVSPGALSAMSCAYDSGSEAVKCKTTLGELGNSSSIRDEVNQAQSEAVVSGRLDKAAQFGVYYAYVGDHDYSDQLQQTTLTVHTSRWFQPRHHCNFDAMITGNCAFAGDLQRIEIDTAGDVNALSEVPMVIVLHATQS